MTRPGAVLSTAGSQKRRAGSLMIFGADTMLKSWGDAEIQSKKGRHVASACCWSRPWSTIAIDSTPPGAKTSCSPQ